MKSLPNSLDEVQLPEQLPPILLTAFNRPDLLKEVLNGIERQILMPRTIIAYVDGPPDGYPGEKKDKIKECINVLENFQPVPIQVRARETNWGVTKNTIDAISNVLNEYSAVIFLEDDVVPAPHYFKTMTLLLEAYKSFEEIFSIQSFKVYRDFNATIDKLSRDFYVSNSFICWGFATWSDRWFKIVGDYEYIRLDSVKTAFKIPTYKVLGSIRNFIFNNFYSSPKKDDWTYRIFLLCIDKYVHIAPRLSLTRNLGAGHPDAVLMTKVVPNINQYYTEAELKTLPKSFDLLPEMCERLSKKEAFQRFGRLIMTRIIISPFLKKIVKRAVHG